MMSPPYGRRDDPPAKVAATAAAANAGPADDASTASTLTGRTAESPSSTRAILSPSRLPATDSPRPPPPPPPSPSRSPRPKLSPGRSASKRSLFGWRQHSHRSTESREPLPGGEAGPRRRTPEVVVEEGEGKVSDPSSLPTTPSPRLSEMVGTPPPPPPGPPPPATFDPAAAAEGTPQRLGGRPVEDSYVERGGAPEPPPSPGVGYCPPGGCHDGGSVDSSGGGGGGSPPRRPGFDDIGSDSIEITRSEGGSSIGWFSMAMDWGPRAETRTASLSERARNRIKKTAKAPGKWRRRARGGGGGGGPSAGDAAAMGSDGAPYYGGAIGPVHKWERWRPGRVAPMRSDAVVDGMPTGGKGGTADRVIGGGGMDFAPASVDALTPRPRPPHPFEVEDSDSTSASRLSEVEWTPPDSAFGAACPVCGWIPKRTRQIIEYTFIAGIALVLVYMVINTSIMLNNEHDGGGSGANSASGGGGGAGGDNSGYNEVDLDDDYYVENSDMNDDDDYMGDDAAWANGRYLYLRKRRRKRMLAVTTMATEASTGHGTDRILHEWLARKLLWGEGDEDLPFLRDGSPPLG